MNMLQKLYTVTSYLELGVYNGLSMAHMIRQTRAPVQCIGVDAFTDPNPRTKGDPEERSSVEAALRVANTSKSSVTLIQGVSDQSATIAAVRRALGTKQVDLLFMNRNNQYAAAAMDFRNYAGHLRVGGLLVVDDANSGFPGIQKFLQESVLTNRRYRVLGTFEGSMLVAQKMIA
jgi:predicted O-methyltransferase YrrM